MSSTSESPAPGLVIHQPVNGFRYSAEAFWLAGFALEVGWPQTAIDIGTGSGIVGGLLAANGVHVDAFDARKEWEPFWGRTLSDSTLQGVLRFHQADVANGWNQCVDLVLSNPPFFKASEGPGSPNLWKRAARTETTATLEEFIKVGAGCMGPGGRLCFVLPIVRGDEAQVYASKHGLFVSRLAYVGKKRVLLEWVKQSTATPVEYRFEETDPTIKRWYALATEPRETP